jgi:hypothetical protein
MWPLLQAVRMIVEAPLRCIEDAVVIEKILTHLDCKAGSAEGFRQPLFRARPRVGPFDGNQLIV